MEEKRLRRIQKEIKYLSEGVEGISSLKEEIDGSYIIKITGPTSSVYEGMELELLIEFTKRYPFEPPYVRFKSFVYHPNIDKRGRICLDLLKAPPSGSWKPIVGIQAVIQTIRLLLSMPNTTDPLVPEIANEYENNYTEFIKKAKEVYFLTKN